VVPDTQQHNWFTLFEGDAACNIILLVYNPVLARDHGFLGLQPFSIEPTFSNYQNMLVTEKCTASNLHLNGHIPGQYKTRCSKNN